MNSIDRLSEIFSRFPGIGPRQAKRFVYYLLSRGTSIEELVKAVQDLKREIIQCSSCMRFYPSNTSGQVPSLCSTCADPNRDSSMLMVVPRDIDFEAIERSGGYKGYYFILGGSVPILEKEPEKRIRLKELQKLVDKKDLKEMILAMNANSEGENTAQLLKEVFKDKKFVISELGRGLSTGAELEYADPETLKSALLHRTN